MLLQVGCCGANNFSDYDRPDFRWNNTFVLENGEQIFARMPPSCCKLTKAKELPTSTDAFEDLRSCLIGHSAYNQVVMAVTFKQHYAVYSFHFTQLLLVAVLYCRECIVQSLFHAEPYPFDI